MADIQSLTAEIRRGKKRRRRKKQDENIMVCPIHRVTIMRVQASTQPLFKIMEKWQISTSSIS